MYRYGSYSPSLDAVFATATRYENNLALVVYIYEPFYGNSEFGVLTLYKKKYTEIQTYCFIMIVTQLNNIYQYLAVIV